MSTTLKTGELLLCDLQPGFYLNSRQVVQSSGELFLEKCFCFVLPHRQSLFEQNTLSPRKFVTISFLELELYIYI